MAGQYADLRELHRLGILQEEAIEVKRRVRAYEDCWQLGAAMYMEALRLAGLPYPSFHFEEQPHPDRQHPERTAVTITIRLDVGSRATERDPQVREDL